MDHTIIHHHHHHHHHDPHIDQDTIRLIHSMASRIVFIEAVLKQLIKAEVIEMATLQDIRQKVEAETSIEQSAIVLLQSIAQQLKDAIASNDPQELQQIADMLDANNAALAQALVENTSAATA